MMRFLATIQTADGGTRVIEHQSHYDATSVLVEHIERDLGPGEHIALKPSPHERGAPQRRTQVPAIERVA